jgi:hypothetical protein
MYVCITSGIYVLRLAAAADVLSTCFLHNQQMHVPSNGLTSWGTSAAAVKHRAPAASWAQQAILGSRNPLLCVTH